MFKWLLRKKDVELVYSSKEAKALDKRLTEIEEDYIWLKELVQRNLQKASYVIRDSIKARDTTKDLNTSVPTKRTGIMRGNE